jgi:cobalt-zinc-cadmium efflux system outer membrane protein
MLPTRSARLARFRRSNASCRLLAAACLGALGIAAAPASAQSTLPGRNVESLLEIARQGNPELASMRLEAAAAREKPESAGALPDPTFRVELMDVTNAGMDASPNLLPSRIGGAKYTVMQMLPWFGKRDAMRGAAEEDAKAAASRADVSWLEVAMKVKTAFAQYYLAVQNERLTQEVLDLMVRLEGVAQARYSGGLAAQQDAIRAQVEQTTMRTDLIMIGAERRRAAARLNALAARPAAAPLAEPEVLRPLPPPARLQPSELRERAVSRNPLIAAEEARARSAARMGELARLERYPDFTVGISPTQMRNRISEWEVMLELNIPLQQDRRRAREREAAAMRDAATAKREAVAVGLAGELEENLAALDAARRAESLAATSLLPQAELTFQSALAGYENGKVDFATLLDAQREIRRAKLERLKAQAEAQMRLAEIERIVGEEL